MQPFFSIIIPVYNVAPYLRECLDSVLTQTFKDWEAICVDDGSTDGSGLILDEYEKKDGRVQVIHKTNGGVGSARNVGLSHVGASWVLFLDGDDVLNPNILMVISEILAKHSDVQMVQFRLQRFVEGIIDWPDDKHGCIFYDISRVICNKSLCSGFSTKVYSRAIIGSLRFAHYAHGEDLLFLSNYLTRISRVVCVDAVGYGYRRRSDSATSGLMTVEGFKDRINAACETVGVYQFGGKRFSSDCYRPYEVNLMQVLAAKIFDFNGHERTLALDYWFEMLDRIDWRAGFSLPCRLKAALCLKFKRRFWVCILGAGCYMIKRRLMWFAKR